MPRSTPGTRFRRRLVMDLQAVRADLDKVTRTWKPASTTFDTVSNERGEVVDVVHRPRRPDEYPENQAAIISHSWNAVCAAINILVNQREELARRYREVLEEQQKEVPSGG